jgi:hypothetical protein
MTWDHIEMFINVGLWSGLVAACSAFGVALVPQFRRAWICVLAFGVSLVASAPILSLAIADDHMSARTEEYPPMVDAFELANPEQQAAMRKVILEAWPRREVFSMTRAQRDRFLALGNYCTAEGFAGCRSLPKGTLSQGEAIEVFPSLGRKPKPCVHVPERPSCT